ncbi:hypothetical protein BDZ97DRAFT_1862703 [Flammula alnicola]|nr:hypothetical protein BDZ97DRAFT_1862703 [Flammula alnicola]
MFFTLPLLLTVSAMPFAISRTTPSIVARRGLPKNLARRPRKQFDSRTTPVRSMKRQALRDTPRLDGIFACATNATSSRSLLHEHAVRRQQQDVEVARGPHKPLKEFDIRTTPTRAMNRQAPSDIIRLEAIFDRAINGTLSRSSLCEYVEEVEDSKALAEMDQQEVTDHETEIPALTQ